MKFFSRNGPIQPNIHYFIPHRLDWDRLKEFIHRRYYYILHAPRQSGKTTSILEFTRQLNQEGLHKAFYINVEGAQAARSDVNNAMWTLLERFKSGISE